MLMKSIHEFGFRSPAPLHKTCIPTVAHQGKDIVSVADIRPENGELMEKSAVGEPLRNLNFDGCISSKLGSKAGLRPFSCS